MSQTFENSSRKLMMEGDAFARLAGEHARADHLLAFNFGRSVGRMENTCDVSWLRVRWPFMGATVGITVAVIYLQIFSGLHILPFAK